MYNRYIPQADGSYRRNRVPDLSRPTPPPPAPPSPPICEPEPSQPCTNEPTHRPMPNHRRPPQPRHLQQTRQEPVNTDAFSFLRKLIPKDFDTGDLMIVLLLLLMAGDCAEDQNTALLTLALYFFM